ncbi:hypothetical protein [Streptomyces avermitilis]|uniref:hypothetical protein n=1 Tax=Streptomyces avermitilis TaxID=33903 RepID=UPI00380B712F
MSRTVPPPHHAELRAAFARMADDVIPSPVPLAEIEREGRTRRRRRRTTALVTCCLLVLAPLAYVSWRLTAAAPGGTAAPSASVPGQAVRVVAAGERVQPLPGVELWLAKDGEHWSTATGSGVSQPEESRKAGGPAVTLRLEEVHDRFLLSGTYRGARQAARAEVKTPSGTTAGTVLTLAGNPGWSVWYAIAPDPKSAGKRLSATARVTVYDARGAVLARSGDAS